MASATVALRGRVGVGRTMARHPTLAAGALLCVAIVALAAGADLLASHSPVHGRMHDAFQPPSAQFLFGTDMLGRDVFARVLYGGRLSLLIGLSTVLATAVCGTLCGWRSRRSCWRSPSPRRSGRRRSTP
jgi:peptide/nickel transport system permease protein